MKKLGIPKGTRDFSPKELQKRRFIESILQSNFQHFGFQEIETPSFENLDVLTGKYGEEGDRLIFKILNSGNFLKSLSEQDWESKNEKILTPKLSEKALRYDLTVPFARYVVQNQNEIVFPFKRFQMQNVWRADRPQKGRFREFKQCDADIIGSNSLWNELNLILLYDSVFTQLNMPVTIQLNHRKILMGIAERTNILDQLIPFTVALDKIDKIGKDKVVDEWKKVGISDSSIKTLKPLLDLGENPKEDWAKLSNFLQDSEIGKQGLEELKWLLDQIQTLDIKQSNIKLNINLARGLNYYTGTILEVTANNVELGSIGGGGRYDDLTGVFGKKNLSGVGISFGLDRIYLAMEELQLFPQENENTLDLLFLNFGTKEAKESIEMVMKMRNAGFKTDLYPDIHKFKKQMNFANKIGVKFVGIIGEEELSSQTIGLKNMETGEQVNLSSNDLIHHFQSET